MRYLKGSKFEFYFQDLKIYIPWNSVQYYSVRFSKCYWSFGIRVLVFTRFGWLSALFQYRILNIYKKLFQIISYIFYLPVIATTFPSNRFLWSEPKVGPRNHNLNTYISNAKTNTAVINDPMVMPTIAPVPIKEPILLNYSNKWVFRLGYSPVFGY